MTTPQERLRRVAPAAGLDPVGPPRPVLSASNDAWLLHDRRLGAVVLRVCWRGDLLRLHREAALLARLPAEVRRPQPLGSGHSGDAGPPLTWSLTRRLDGVRFDHAWPGLPARKRHAAVAQLADQLRALHGWTAPVDLADALRARPGMADDDPASVIGADVHLLPVRRVHLLVEPLRRVPHLDAGLTADALALVDVLAPLDPALDDPSRHGPLHQDVHLENLWLDGSGRLVLLDFEWARFGPPALELQPLCDKADSDVHAGRDRHPTLLRWLRDGYPRLFAGVDLPARLRLYSLTSALRDLIVSPPRSAADAHDPQHSLHRLRRLVDGDWPAPGALP